jgi:hypothetical protein
MFCFNSRVIAALSSECAVIRRDSLRRFLWSLIVSVIGFGQGWAVVPGRSPSRVVCCRRPRLDCSAKAGRWSSSLGVQPSSGQCRRPGGVVRSRSTRVAVGAEARTAGRAHPGRASAGDGGPAPADGGPARVVRPAGRLVFWCQLVVGCRLGAGRRLGVRRGFVFGCGHHLWLGGRRAGDDRYMGWPRCVGWQVIGSRGGITRRCR